MSPGVARSRDRSTVSRLAELPFRVLVARGLRRLTAPLRSLPDALVIGGMRCGSSSLYQWLREHPDVYRTLFKELHFFDFNFHRGTNWYRAFYPVRTSDVLTFDATPSYMAYPSAAWRAREVVPHARLIVLLRNPTERAWSHYRFRRSKGYESRTFAEVIASELGSGKKMNIDSVTTAAGLPLVAGGLYADQLRPWFELFGRKNIMVLDSDRMFGDPSATWREVQSFLGLTPVQIAFVRANASPPGILEPELFTLLDDYYSKPNRDLTELTGQVFRWA